MRQKMLIEEANHMGKLHHLLFLGAMALLSGCASMDVYIPKTVGPTANHNIGEALAVRISTQEDFVARGEPVTFSVTVKNISADSLWLPEDPKLLIVWTYPNGCRDNLLQDPPQQGYYDQRTAIQLAPGEEMTLKTGVKTQYFNIDGVTEFRAVLEVAGNTNPDLQPFWTGRSVSNGYGVMLANKRRIGQLAAQATKKSVGDRS
jgi:hypothetical protein